MDEGVRAGFVLITLGGAILAVIALAIQGPGYVWLAVLVFGVIAAGLIGMGLYSITCSAG
ncbi:MAG TPA: hypothetical protein VNA15_08700 [Candidatus Angelobacter sp.]|nr:hypothetical protein [Candidatus Angelobacter sp.]